MSQERDEYLSEAVEREEKASERLGDASPDEFEGNEGRDERVGHAVKDSQVSNEQVGIHRLIMN